MDAGIEDAVILAVEQADADPVWAEGEHVVIDGRGDLALSEGERGHNQDSGCNHEHVLYSSIEPGTRLMQGLMETLE